MKEKEWMVKDGMEKEDRTMKGRSRHSLGFWTEDEAELLLKVTHEYKVKTADENVVWESVHSKYSDIWEQRKWQLSSNPEEVRKIGKDYPQKKEEITKQSVSTKLK